MPVVIPPSPTQVPFCKQMFAPAEFTCSYTPLQAALSRMQPACRGQQSPVHASGRHSGLSMKSAPYKNPWLQRGLAFHPTNPITCFKFRMACQVPADRVMSPSISGRWYLSWNAKPAVYALTTYLWNISKGGNYTMIKYLCTSAKTILLCTETFPTGI